MKTKYVLTTGLVLVLGVATEAQVLNRLKQRVENKAEQKAGEEIDKLFSGKNKNQSGQSGQGTNGPGGSNSGGNNPSNKGGGLISTPPDVNQNLTDAQAAYTKNSYGEARYAVQQAMLGVELEIGNKVLKSLPETVAGLNKEAKADQVTSTGWGWAGLMIKREYSTKDKEFRVIIANNSVWMAAVNTYLASGGYAQQTNGEQNWKQTKLKGYRAIIEYNERSGYKLSVPLGQSSLIVFEGVSFASETDMMKAAEVFNLDGIKKELGEQ
ncbi:MAG: hypothetical protein BroJett042_14240 [Bacteroidota bacterium]|nr:MAG: hypothetical protein BroJett042_14240 [Bacteroidota bacterium]